jgi:hypothetical protein
LKICFIENILVHTIWGYHGVHYGLQYIFFYILYLNTSYLWDTWSTGIWGKRMNKKWGQHGK